MEWKVVFAPRALDDLAGVVRYIAQNNPEAAERIGQNLIDRALILQKFPWLGAPYKRRAGTRELLSKPYLIFYRVVEEERRIDILRYWHGSRGEPGQELLSM